ncbi:hypothetical protein PIB30_064756, partial [Stylosanthes scabra]|nr:hypothetical protein [Stylosanthes scabra]
TPQMLVPRGVGISMDPPPVLVPFFREAGITTKLQISLSSCDPNDAPRRNTSSTCPCETP